MSDQNRYPLRLRFSGKSVEKNGLDLYDGSTSFYGFAQAIQILVNAYLNNEVVSRATALKGAEVYFGSPRKGSVLFDLLVVAEKSPVVAGASVAVFYDFVKYAFNKAAGYLDVVPETNSISKLSEDETFFDELAETLEGSLQRAHRAIDNGVNKVTIERPRSELVVFDAVTSQWVNTRDEKPDIVELTGSVTRYNSITGNGRAFVRELDRVIPFRPAFEFPDNKRGLLSWSLHGNTVVTSKELRFWASQIESATGEPKRLILSDCVQA